MNRIFHIGRTSGDAAKSAKRCGKKTALRFRHPRRNASSLVTTLLVLVVLSAIVVAFMQTMSVERNIARSASNRLRAEMAVQAGINAAVSDLQFFYSKYPDSATAWQPLFLSGTKVTEGTVFHFRGEKISGEISVTNAPVPASPSAFGGNLSLYAKPLLSGALATTETNLDHAFSVEISATNGIDLNRDQWIGVVPGQTQKQLWAMWVEILQDPSAARDLSIDSSTGKPRNPPVARYAFWVEDESFRANLAVSTNRAVGTNTLTSPGGASANPVLAEADDPSRAQQTADNIIAARKEGVFLSPHQFANAAGTDAARSNLSTNLPFLVTLHSSAFNMSRGGWKRVSVNNLLSASTNLRAYLDRFIATITNSNAAPLFGQRFLREGSPSSSSFTDTLNSTNYTSTDNATIYLQKLAANARDFVDTDCNPTLIDRDTYAIRASGEPTEGIEPAGGGTSGDNPLAAFGKENVPMLHEYAVHARLLEMTPRGWSGTRGTANFRFSYDHYFEFWNMGTKDIYITNAPAGAVELGTNAFLLLYNQPPFDSPYAYAPPNPEIPEGRPIKVQLASVTNLVFPAGKPVVLTTAPSGATNAALIRSGAIVYTLPVDSTNRIFSGTTRDSSTDHTLDAGGATLFNNTYRVLLYGRSTTSGQSDYESCVVLGNGNGLLDSHCALPIVRTSGYAIEVNHETADRLDSDKYFVRGGSLRGNDGMVAGPQSDVGDPRTLNEQLFMQIYESGSTAAQTRFYSSSLNNDSVPASSTIGTLNTNYVEPNDWPDYSLDSSSAGTANAFVRDGPMETVGDFGHLFDPARVIGDAPSIGRVRGGGRTLNVGQTDKFNRTTNRSGLWDGSQTSASRTWAAWRLTDFFDISSDTEIAGAINPNGALRDNGLALRQLVEGFVFGPSPETPSNIAGHSMTTNQIDALVSAVTNRLHGTSTNSANNDVIFWERGELSELPIFSTGTNLAGQNLAKTIDRGREEVVRRIIQATATKGNVFSVYCVGQALEVKNEKVVPSATSRQRAIFKFELGTTPPDDNFDPADASQVANRFRAMTNFSVTNVVNFP